MRPVQHQTWESFSRAWDVDVRHVFNWTREALLAPLDPGSTVVALSSGAALRGSPLSGGYAGAKATIRFITSYAAGESARNGLGIRFTAVLPGLNPATGVGAAGAAGYARRDGTDLATFTAGLGAPDPGEVGTAIATLATDAAHTEPAYLVTPTGLAPTGLAPA